MSKEIITVPKRKESGTRGEQLQQKLAPDAKRMMTENLGKAHRVWSAFSKFIKSQVCSKRRVVDTGLIGLFCCNSDH